MKVNIFITLLPILALLRFLFGEAEFYSYFCIKPDDGPIGAETCSTVKGILLHNKYKLYIHVTVHRNRFLFNNQPDALIIQIYSV